MEIQGNNNRSQNGRLHRKIPSSIQLIGLNKESPHERRFPSFIHADRNLGKPGLKYKVGIDGINHGETLDFKARGGEKTQSPGAETSLDASDILKVVARAASGRKKGGWHYKKKADNRLIDLTNVEFWLHRFADITSAKEDTISLSPGEETQDFRKLDELEIDDRIPRNSEAVILEGSIRKRLVVKSITEVCTHYCNTRDADEGEFIQMSMLGFSTWDWCDRQT